jgi:GT2 family glycosyltransferase
MGAALLCRRELFDNIGLLDERFFMYSEETDLCMRARRLGWLVVLLEDVTVVHVGGGSASRNDLRQLQLLYENKIAWFAKHRGGLQAAILRVLLVLSTLFGILRRTAMALLRRDGSAATRANIRVRLQLLRDLAAGRVAASVNLPPASMRDRPVAGAGHPMALSGEVRRG